MRDKIYIYMISMAKIIACFFILLIVVTGNKKTVIATSSNTNKAVSVTALNYKSSNQSQNIIYGSFLEALQAAKLGQQSSFNGKLTGYGPDCKGCGGGSACAPRQDFRNGNIYYNDPTYGKIRVVAADRALPCGSIVKITGITIYSEPIIAIVMDRGGAIKSNHLDLLFATEKNLEGFYTHKNIQFDILRLGF